MKLNKNAYKNDSYFYWFQHEIKLKIALYVC